MGQASRYGSFLISVAIGQCRVHAQEPITPTPNQEGMGVGILLHHVLDAQFGAYLCICSIGSVFVQELSTSQWKYILNVMPCNEYV